MKIKKGDKFINLTEGDIKEMVSLLRRAITKNGIHFQKMHLLILVMVVNQIQ